MRKLFSILFLLLIPFSKVVHAGSTVNVTTQNNSNCQTNVSITTNGEMKTYHSEDCNQNVDIESSDGSSKVSVRNQVNTDSNNLHPTILPTRSIRVPTRNLVHLSDTPTATASPTQKPSAGGKSDLHQSFLDRIFQHFQFLSKLFPWI